MISPFPIISRVNTSLEGGALSPPHHPQHLLSHGGKNLPPSSRPPLLSLITYYLLPITSTLKRLTALQFYSLTVFLLLPLFAFSAGVNYSERITPHISATDLSLTPEIWLHGMVEHRIAIDNSGPVPASVSTVYSCSMYASGESIRQTWRQAIVAAPGSRTLATAYRLYPGSSAHSTGTEIDVPGYKKKALLAENPSVVERYSTHSPLNLLLSRGISAEGLKNRLQALAPEVKKGGSSYFRSSEFYDTSFSAVRDKIGSADAVKNLNPRRFEGEGSAWPRHWLAFSSFDGCLIAASDYNLMPAETRQALFDYVAAGGHIAFFGMPTLPDDWPSMIPVSRLSDHPVSPKTAKTAIASTNRNVNVGLGQALVLQARSADELSNDDITTLYDGWTQALYRWLHLHESAADNNASIPTVGSINVPMRGFILVLLVFVLLAGPGVIIYTHRTGRRLLMLLLAPAVSLAFSMIIVAYALLSEGVTPTIRRQALTLLDQRAQRAVTYGAIGVYAPVSLRDGLHFDIGTEIIPLSKRRTATTIVGADNHLRSGWAQPRVPVFFQLRRSEPRAERLVVNESAAGTVEIINALGATITRLRLSDHNGYHYETDNLAPGEKRVVRHTDRNLVRTAAFWTTATPVKRDKPDAGWGVTDYTAMLSAKNMSDLVPEAGAYLAVLADTPFIENPLAYCHTKGSATSIIMGWY